MPSVEEEIGGNNCGHSSDKPTVTSVSQNPSEIDVSGIGNRSMEDHLNVLDASPDSETETKTKTKTMVDLLNEYRKDAEFALAHYKEDTGLDYEYTGVRFVAPFRFPSGYRGSHFNFYARLSGSGSKEMVLFYAELNYDEKKVYNCCILPGEHDSKVMLHPPHVKCKGCETVASYGVGAGPYFAESDEFYF